MSASDAASASSEFKAKYEFRSCVYFSLLGQQSDGFSHFHRSTQLRRVCVLAANYGNHVPTWNWFRLCMTDISGLVVQVSRPAVGRYILGFVAADLTTVYCPIAYVTS